MLSSPKRQFRFYLPLSQMADPEVVPSRRSSHRDIHATRVGDDSAIKRTRPEAEPFKRKRDGRSSSSSLRSGKELQEALAQSSSNLSLDGLGEDDKALKVPVETQVATLEPYQPVGEEDVAEYGKVSLQAEIYQQIFHQARRLNYNISDLEVVLVGQRNQGKSSLLQAVLGLPIALGRTRRSFHFHLVNDPSISTPRFIIKEQFKETKCTLEQLQQELTKRNRARMDPVTLVIEYKWGFDLTIVDTPPIRSLEELAVWARPAMTGTANRYLVAVEAAKPIKDIHVLQWLKHFDPSFSRSMLVLTGFDNFLASYQANPRKALIPFGEMEHAPCFWMSLPSYELARECGLDANLFKRRVWQHHQRDLEALRLLDLDYSANSGQLGIYTFRKHLDTVFKTDLHRHLPALTRAFEVTIANHEKSLASSSAAISSWNTDNIRAMATTYTNAYLRHMDALIKGSVAGTPKKNGQSLQDEIEDFARWDSSSHDTLQSFGLPFSSSNANQVPHGKVKLYGAPQLLRLLEEFRITASQVQMPSIDNNELIGSLDTAWAASEIARRKIEHQFVPLLDHLMARTFYIMRRMTLVCDLVAEGQTHTTGQKLALNQKNFPAFSTFLRQSYIAAQAQALQQCHAKSKEEFCTSLTIYWELTGGLASFDQNKDPNERLKNITQAAQSIYAKIKERLIEAFILNVQTHFLAATAILKFSKSVAADVSTLNAATIKDMFVLDQIKDIHQADIQASTTELKAIKDLETTFLSKLVPALKI